MIYDIWGSKQIKKKKGRPKLGQIEMSQRKTMRESPFEKVGPKKEKI